MITRTQKQRAQNLFSGCWSFFLQSETTRQQLPFWCNCSHCCFWPVCVFSSHVSKRKTGWVLPLPFPAQPRPGSHPLRRTLGLQAAGSQFLQKPHPRRVRTRQVSLFSGFQNRVTIKSFRLVVANQSPAILICWILLSIE